MRYYRDRPVWKRQHWGYGIPALRFSDWQAGWLAADLPRDVISAVAAAVPSIHDNPAVTAREIAVFALTLPGVK
jgi:hypothetical protein